MRGARPFALGLFTLLLALAVVHGEQPVAGQGQQGNDRQSGADAAGGRETGGRDEGDSPFRFRGGIELINVTATVYDRDGHFVPGLQQDDFTIYEDGQPQPIALFNAERVPVSLGIVLDTSGSMAGDKIQSARNALDRFLNELLDEGDEVFLYRFSDSPLLVEGWTDDRSRITRALNRIAPNGATALYDAVYEAIPLAQSGTRRKKALLIISDGNDTTSAHTLRDLRARIRESEVLVYAIGIDGQGEPMRRAAPFPPRGPMGPFPRPFPRRPGGGRRWPQLTGPMAAPVAPQIGIPGPFTGQFPPVGRPQPPRFPGNMQPNDDRVNTAALRELTDDSGGRTEIIRDAQDLVPATEGIADELSRQYFLGYPASGVKDGRYHSIRVEVRDRTYRVRARRGYVAN